MKDRDAAFEELIAAIDKQLAQPAKPTAAADSQQESEGDGE